MSGPIGLRLKARGYSMKGLLVLLLLGSLTINLHAQANETPDEVGAKLDARVFDAYNKC